MKEKGKAAINSTLLYLHSTHRLSHPRFKQPFSPLCHRIRYFQAGKYFAAALQLDPDNSEAAGKYKTLRKAASETVRIRGEIDKALAG
jgi:hypothetical protein